MRRVLLTLAVLCLSASMASADWAETDGHKMHWPQLPDPLGWDIDVTAPNIVADDWMCSRTGPVKDIHIWFSLEQDGAGVNPEEIISQVESLRLSIHKDIPAIPGTPDGYSRPGELLWEYFPQDPVIAGPRFGSQGWADPADGVWRPGDHSMFFQANIFIDDPRDAFVQHEGEIYWLDVDIKMVDGYEGSHLGWKTTFRTKDRPGGGWNDDAVYWVEGPIGGAGHWAELWEFGDMGGTSLDMAFVITPEPSTIAMLVGVCAMGLMAYLRRRK
ncbi:MAG: hypothetical protein A2V70_01550 [Planctomycetes bacterium RBG_13_63_9]|nr:MAG: hypothetical protein A2V70_01550 [Planctomycetes bacterium RBG_13_63_9]